MTDHTYRLAVALQARALQIIDTHTAGVHPVAHDLGDFTVLARYRQGADRRSIHICARDHQARILGSAQAHMPIGGGPITSSVTEFRAAHIRMQRRIIPTGEQYRDPTRLATGTLANAPEADITYGFHGSAHADYYLVPDWSPGRSPWQTTWSLIVATRPTGLVLRRTHVDFDTAVHSMHTWEAAQLATV